jgi:2-hydroxychromene-2-carboxylate isomerase
MAGSSTDSGDRAFYFDLSSPDAYLAAERVLQVVEQPCEWVPVALPFDPAFRCAEEVAAYREDLERRAAAQGVQRVRWPEPFPFDSTFAQLAATFAKGSGKTVAFALAAFRQAFAGGRDLSVEENVLVAAAACEMHPRALLAGTGTAGTRRRLEEATALARERGVAETPALWTGDRVVPVPPSG